MEFLGGVIVGAFAVFFIAFLREFFELRDRVDELEDAVFECEDDDPKPGETKPAKEGEKVVDLKARKSA